MGLRVRLFILVVASVLAAIAGMRAHQHATEHANSTEDGGPIVVEPPVDAPAGLLAEVVVATPDATWRKAQVAIGGFLLLTPPTAGGMLAATEHIPALATIVDGEAPAYAVAGTGGKWVIAFHAVTKSRAHSTLVAADGGTSDVVKDASAGSIEMFRGEHAWVGLAGGFVLVAESRELIAALGPYAYRTLPSRPLPQSAVWASVTHDVLSGPLKATLEKRRDDLAQFLLQKDDEQRAAHGGRAPDLADPKAIVTAFDGFTSRYIEELTAMASAELAADLDADGIHVQVTMKAPPDGPAHVWASELEGGSTAPLAASSDEPVATLFWRSSTPERERVAKEFGDTLAAALGSRIPSADEAKLTELLGQIARARAGWSMVSMTSGAAAGGLLRLATNDAPAITTSIESAIDLARKPGWSAWERDALGIRKIERKPGHATFTTDAASLQASWAARGGELDLAAGLDANAILDRMSSQATLAADARIGAWLKSLRTEVVWALVARPLALAPAPGAKQAQRDPLLLALVRGPRDVVLDARTTGPLLRQLAVTSWKGLGL